MITAKWFHVLPLLAGLLLAACGEEQGAGAKRSQEAARPTGLAVASDDGCRIDDDCSAGTFCFQNACVRECRSDADCGDGAFCSERSRCLRETAVEAGPISVDAGAAAVSATDVGSIEVLQWPPGDVLVRAGEPFVTVSLRTAEPLPGGVLLYTVETGAGRETYRAEGTTHFELQVPTGKAGGDEREVEVVRLVTALGRHTLYLIPQPPVAGRYAGAFTPQVFGGAGLPLDLVIETEPTEVLTLEEAERVWVWIPANADHLVSLLAPAAESADFVRRPLEWDEANQVWVATFASGLDAAAYFGAGVFPGAQRSLRLEIFEANAGSLRGAIADRWYGIHERRSADGVVSEGVANVSGYFSIDRLRSIPAGVSVLEGDGSTPPAPAAPAPLLSACLPAHFAIEGESDTESGSDEGEVPSPGPCAGIETAADFDRAGADRRATCALAVADRALDGPTISSMLQALLDPEQPNPDGMSFASFIEACATPGNPLCQPTEELLCARDLVAHAYRDADATGETIARLAQAYDTATSESFVGRQLAAFHVDTQSRLDWLESAEAPPFLASTLLDYNQAILREWKANVFDAHLSSVFGQLDEAGLAVLGRATTDPEALARRRELLLDLSNSWRAAMDALQLLTERWNVLYQADVQRAQAASTVRQAAFRLYASAAVTQELARTVGSGYLVSEFGAGFSGLMRELARLSMPFDDLIYARDAEVVVARSVDPDEDSRSLLGRAEEAARKAVVDAAWSVDLVLDEARQTEIDEVVLTARYEDQLLSLRDELILLCGLPADCAPADVGADPACAIPTEAGRCGFMMEAGSSEVFLPAAGGDESAVSEAGQALLDLQESLLAVREAEERVQAHAQVSALTGETVEAFAAKVEEWDDRRRSVAAEVDALLAEIREIDDERIQANLDALREEQALREQAYQAQAMAMDVWHQINVDGNEADMRRLGAITGLDISASALEFTAERTDTMAAIMKDATPRVVGASTDPSFAARMGVRFPAFIVSTALGTVAQTLDGVANGLEDALVYSQAVREAELSRLQDLRELGAMRTENEIADLEAQLETVQLQSEQQMASLQALIDALKRNLELDLAHEADLMELRDRRDAWRIQLVDAIQLAIEAAQADLTVRQRENAYFAVVQRAQLLEGRFRNMQMRWQNLESLLGSPDVLFSFANRMARAESRIDTARRALEEWLVALEYYAVRPFVSQRMAILLARNPAQLEAIANEFSRLQMVCGGPSTLETVDVSLRDDLLGMSFDRVDEGGEVVPAAERFRALLARAESSLRSDVVYTAGERVRERIDRGEVLAVSFGVDLEGFANLPQTCNAKIDSVALQLVGEDLGGGQPVVSLIHHGASQLRSCQPDIGAYVASLGPGATAFGPVTGFRTPGRTIAPVAGIGAWGEALAWSRTLEGVPFASDYTVLIDLEHPSNEQVAWERLEDIRIQFRFTYQDVFPEGQCE